MEQRKHHGRLWLLLCDGDACWQAPAEAVFVFMLPRVRAKCSKPKIEAASVPPAREERNSPTSQHGCPACLPAHLACCKQRERSLDPSIQSHAKSAEISLFAERQQKYF